MEIPENQGRVKRELFGLGGGKDLSGTSTAIPRPQIIGY